MTRKTKQKRKPKKIKEKTMEPELRCVIGIDLARTHLRNAISASGECLWGHDSGRDLDLRAAMALLDRVETTFGPWLTAKGYHHQLG